ncbi:hypothetical protein BDV24DRAFT_72295 [Aspergillus arachidicola]|uniref:Uncharacterized protein n=1 Tax=Aspergillus arachidicola TaxID=656916 RepID=A0A5N6Y5C9_9EURO|nr:hypothetical protein BDV24DRAFT_72295 [Aspergillus arachidicola]
MEGGAPPDWTLSDYLSNPWVSHPSNPVTALSKTRRRAKSPLGTYRRESLPLLLEFTLLHRTCCRVPLANRSDRVESSFPPHVRSSEIIHSCHRHRISFISRHVPILLRIVSTIFITTVALVYTILRL